MCVGVFSDSIGLTTTTTLQNQQRISKELVGQQKFEQNFQVNRFSSTGDTNPNPIPQKIRETAKNERKTKKMDNGNLKRIKPEKG